MRILTLAFLAAHNHMISGSEVETQQRQLSPSIFPLTSFSGRTLGPSWTRQFGAPNGAALVHWALRFDNHWGFPFNEPDMRIRRLFSHKRCHYSGGTSNVYLHNVARCLALGADDEEWVFPIWSDHKFYDPWLWGGHNHGHCRFRRARFDILEHREYEAIGEVRRQFEMLGHDFIF